MISFERSKIMPPVAQDALRKLYTCTAFSDGYAFQVGATLKEILSQNDKYSSELKKVIESLADKDEKGVPIVSENQYKMTEENQAMAMEATKVSYENIITVSRPRLHLSKLAPAALSAVEYATIDFLIDEEK